MVSTVGDRARFRRDQESRSRERRLAAYSDYGRAMKANVNAMLRVAAHVGNDPNPHPNPHPHPLRPEDAEHVLAATVEARDLAWETLLLLGSAEVNRAAQSWFATVAEIEHWAHDATRDRAAWADLVETRQVETRLAFYAAARRDLGFQPVDPATRPVQP